MTLLVLYLATLGSFGLASALISGTSPYALMGGSKYEWRARRRLLGQIFFAIAGVCLVVALAAQLSSFLMTPQPLGPP
jgi:hypothetical protein